MLKHAFIIVAGLALTLVGARGESQAREQRELESNRAKWEHYRITNYEVRLRDDRCACWHALGYGPVRVVVKQGAVQKAIYEGERRDGYWAGHVISKSKYRDAHLIATVEQLFQKAQRVIDSRDEQHRIDYHSRYGFPVLIDVDDPPGWADAAWRLIVDDFHPKP